jgi:cephalosporin hydroxylase
VEEFHTLWYDSYTWHGGVTWEGVPVLKNPFDLWMYQQVIFDEKPDLVIETGTYLGGSALYLARLLDIVSHGSVVSIDVKKRELRPDHPRICYIEGSSTSSEVVELLARRASKAQRVMVILDADHSKRHVAEELKVLSPFVTVWCHLVVEDTNVNGNPARPGHGPGPMEAVREFLELNHDDFIVDSECERYMLTFNPSGWLKRVSSR